MLSSISWNEYLWVCGIAAIAYYLVIGWVYYKADFAKLFHQSPEASLKPMSESQDISGDDITLVQQYSLAEQMKKEIKELFVSLPSGKISAKELVQTSKERITGFALLKDPGLRTAINNLFTQQAKINHKIELAERDILPLWNDASYNDKG